MEPNYLRSDGTVLFNFAWQTKWCNRIPRLNQVKLPWTMEKLGFDASTYYQTITIGIFTAQITAEEARDKIKTDLT